MQLLCVRGTSFACLGLSCSKLLLTLFHFVQPTYIVFARVNTRTGVTLPRYAPQVIRAVILAVCYPLLKITGYSVTLRKAVVMVWAGLRGAVGLALSMFILFDRQVSDRSFRVLAFFFMGLIAAITILVQGTTTGILLQVGLWVLRNIVHATFFSWQAFHARQVPGSSLGGSMRCFFPQACVGYRE